MKRVLISCLAVIILAFTLPMNAKAQKIAVSGSVKDTSVGKPLQYAVIMALRLRDSSLVTFTRTDKDGLFKLDSLLPDTYNIVVSHSRFGDQSFIILGDEKVVDLKEVILPPKTVALTEVTIVGYSDAVYFRGDTLVYIADSFKVKKNAVVEDLLKKLPGIKVEKDGKI